MLIKTFQLLIKNELEFSYLLKQQKFEIRDAAVICSVPLRQAM